MQNGLFVISQHRQAPPRGWAPSVAGGKKHWPPEPAKYLTARGEVVLLYRLVPSFITDIVGGGKRRLCAHQLSLSIWRHEKQLEVTSEAVEAERQDPTGEAKSQLGFLYAWDFIHTVSLGMEAVPGSALALLYKGFICASLSFLKIFCWHSSQMM